MIKFFDVGFFSVPSDGWVIMGHNGNFLHDTERIVSWQRRVSAGANLAGLAVKDSAGHRQTHKAQINYSPEFN